MKQLTFIGLSLIISTVGCMNTLHANEATNPSSTSNPGPKSGPQIVMGSTYSNWSHIAEKGNYDQWGFVRANIDGWLLHINRIGEKHPAGKSDHDFNRIIDIMKERKIKLYVESKSYYVDEARGTDIANIGYHDALRDINYLQRVYDAGHKVSVINFDGAFFDYTKLGLSNPEALENLITYYSTIHAKWPDIELYFLFNLPNWGWKGERAYRTAIPGNPMYMGDAYAVYHFVVQGMNKAGVPLAGICVDNPYDYAIGAMRTSKRHTGVDIEGPDWIGRILALERMSRRDGLKFSIIFNSERGGHNAADLYARDTVSFINTYYKRGGNPDVAIMESWYPKPAEWLPETDSTTMAGSVKAAIKAICYIKKHRLE